MADRITLVVLRPCLLRGDVLAPGRSRLAVADAAAIVDAGKAELIDKADAAKLEAWRKAELKRVLREQGPAPRAEPLPGPWRPQR